MKKIFALLLALFLFTANFIGCAEDTPELKDPNNEENQPPVQDTENPATDFEYEENEEGGITIVKYIGTNADVIVPSQINGKDVTVLGEGSFCPSYDFLLSVTIPDTVTTIGACAFWRCDKLTTVVLSQNLTTIDREAFKECTNLADIVLPDSLEVIKTQAFNRCTSLKRINIPASLTEWYNAVFSECKIETVDIAEGVEIIPMGAFFNNDIKELVLPSSMKEIQLYAFEGCRNLTTVILNEGLEKIDYQAFAYTGFTEIIIPESVYDMTEMAFVDCDLLEKVFFEGNAPESYDDSLHPGNVDYTVYYHEGAQGFTSPEWCGYPTKIW